MVLTKGEMATIPFEDMRVGGTVLAGTLSFALFSVLSKKVTIPSFHSVTYFFASATIFLVLSLYCLDMPYSSVVASSPQV